MSGMCAWRVLSAHVDLHVLSLFAPPFSDVLVERAAAVLRLLFLHDMRASQNLANELMGLAQEYTSDPKTVRKTHSEITRMCELGATMLLGR